MSFHVENRLSLHNFVAVAKTNLIHPSGYRWLRGQPKNGNVRGRLAFFFVFCLLLALSGHGAAQNAEPPSDMSGPPRTIKTVFLIIMENHNWTGAGTNSLKQNDAAPYINYVLVPQASRALNYYNPPRLHPSLPNYLWLEAGTNFGIYGGTPVTHHLSTHDHLVAMLEKRGISWRSYEEWGNGYTCPYQHWHSPFLFFDDVTENNNLFSNKCIEHIRPFRELKRDLEANRTARYNFIVPNACDNMHTECEGRDQIQAGDRWLAENVPAILRSDAFRRDGVLFIVFDEGEFGDGPIPLLVLSPLAKGNGYANHTYYTHSSLLRTIQEIFGVTPLLRDAAKHPDLRDLFVQFP